MRIVFMGTPSFAAVSLKKLIDEGFDVVGVLTRPDKPKNRGMKLCFSPVKEIAVSCGIPVFQPGTLKTDAASDCIRDMSPDLIVVVAYGLILPKSVLEIPSCGCVNVHASLLPRHRGSSPIQWAVINGDDVTGVTTMYMAPELDSGDMIYKSETKIGEFETAGELFERLAVIGAELLCKTIRDIQTGTAPRIPQDNAAATYVSMLDKTMSPIDWNRSPREIIKSICGLSPWPVATAAFGDTTFKVFSAVYTENKTNKAPGAIVAADDRGIEVACSGGATVIVTELQAPGGKRMKASDYLRGHPIAAEVG